MTRRGGMNHKLHAFNDLNHLLSRTIKKINRWNISGWVPGIFCAQMSRIELRQLWDTHLPATCLKCVQSVSMCHYQIGHTSFPGEMKVFHILVTSALCWCATHQNLKDIARGKRLSTLYALWLVMWSHACVCMGVRVCVPVGCAFFRWGDVG